MDYDEALKIVSDFVERYNKQDEEQKVADAIACLQDYSDKMELNS